MFHGQGKKNFDKFFDEPLINKIGKASGFVQRQAKKITAYNFVVGFLQSVCKGQYSFEAWAIQIGFLIGQSVTKQALFERIHEGATAFAKQLLQQTLLLQVSQNYSSALFDRFRRVILHDSSTLGLPDALRFLFPGNISNGKQKAVARIQAMMDIKAMNFLDFSLGSFTENDQSASGSILFFVKKGDIVIRDLGYMAIDTFKLLKLASVDFLSRLKFNVGIYDKHGRQISVKSLLQAGKVVDREVFIGAKKEVMVRLVMIPLPPGEAAERRRRARNDRDKRANHSKEYYKWLGYSIYITSVGKDTWTATQVGQAYRVRWQIEIIFKSWKSCFHMQDMLQEGSENEHRVKVSIYLMLLFTCLFMGKVYVRYRDKIERETGKMISLLKLAAFIANYMIEIFLMPPSRLQACIAQHCCYERRRDRENMTELYQKFKN